MPMAILTSIQAPVHVIDRHFKLIWTNGFTGGDPKYTSEKIVGKKCHQALLGRDHPCPDCPVVDVFYTGRHQVREKLFTEVNPIAHWREVHSFPIKDHKGRTLYAVKIGFDITSQKQAHARMERYLYSLEKSLGESSDQEIESPKKNFGLTPRELEVLKLLAQGFTRENMAQILGISPNTVKTHIVHVYDKLDVSDRAQAAVMATRLGII
jgi:DNA-binding CsgD family transcriptional regulator